MELFSTAWWSALLAIILIGITVDRVLFQTVEGKLRRRWGLAATT